MSFRFLGVIPARGGSKRVKRKNIRILNGKPLIYYSIDAAKRSSRLNHFVVSSEDKEILDTALKYLPNENILKRPSSISGDNVRNTETLKHAVNSLQDKSDQPFTHVVLLQPTSPFRTTEDIDNAINIFEKSECKTLASVSPAIKKRDNILKRRIDNTLCCDLIQSETPFEFMRYNAAIYIVEINYLFLETSFKDDLQSYYEMSDVNSIDVDTEIDLAMAEFLMTYNFK